MLNYKEYIFNNLTFIKKKDFLLSKKVRIFAL